MYSLTKTNKYNKIFWSAPTDVFALLSIEPGFSGIETLFLRAENRPVRRWGHVVCRCERVFATTGAPPGDELVKLGIINPCCPFAVDFELLKGLKLEIELAENNFVVPSSHLAVGDQQAVGVFVF